MQRRRRKLRWVSSPQNLTVAALRGFRFDSMKTYAEKLKDPRWQELRLKVMERDGFCCVACSNKEKTLHVHHCSYVKGINPWEYPHQCLVTLCDSCHERIETGYRKFMAGLLAVHALKIDIRVFSELCKSIQIGIDSLEKPKTNPLPPEVMSEAQEILLHARDNSLWESFA